MSGLQLALALLKRSARLDELAGMARFGINPEKRLTVRFWSRDAGQVLESDVAVAAGPVSRGGLPVLATASLKPRIVLKTNCGVCQNFYTYMKIQQSR